MNQTQTGKKLPARKAPVWAAALAALACGAGLWLWAGSGENAGSVICTVLAAAVLAATLVLSVCSHPRVR